MEAKTKLKDIVFTSAFRTAIGKFKGSLKEFQAHDLGKEVIKKFLIEKTAGTLIFTGASASLRGKSNFGAFNSAKGALRNLAQALAKEYAENSIHISHVIVDGGLAGERIKQRLSDFEEKDNCIGFRPQ